MAELVDGWRGRREEAGVDGFTVTEERVLSVLMLALVRELKREAAEEAAAAAAAAAAGGSWSGIVVRQSEEGPRPCHSRREQLSSRGEVMACGRAGAAARED